MKRSTFSLHTGILYGPRIIFSIIVFSSFVYITEFWYYLVGRKGINVHPKGGLEAGGMNTKH